MTALSLVERDDAEKCPLCGDPEHECWGAYKGLNENLCTAWVDSEIVTCRAWSQDLLKHIAEIGNDVERLRACIIWYSDPNPSGGMLHLTLEEGGYDDRIIQWQIDRSREDGYGDEAGFALAEALLRFTPEQREHANRYENPFVAPEPWLGEGIDH